MLNSLSRNQQTPQIMSRCGCVDPLPGRLPYVGYESPCSGRHYCLRGMDYCAGGAPSTERRLRPLCAAEQPTVRFAGLGPPRPALTPRLRRRETPKSPTLPLENGARGPPRDPQVLKEDTSYLSYPMLQGYKASLRRVACFLKDPLFPGLLELKGGSLPGAKD